MTRRTEDSLPEPSVDCDASSRLEKNSVDVPHNVSVATLLEKKSRRSLESTASSICFSVDASSSSSTFAGRLSTETRWTASTASVAVVDSHTDLKAPQAPVTFLKLLLAHIGAALALFLATTDATIISTSLPTIVADLHASQSQYSWPGVAYLLTQTAFQPLYGRFSDLFGRKPVLYSAITIFMAGSMLCAISPNYVLLCVFRALAGIGGGGIVSSVWLITSELVEENERAKWSQALSVTWSASAIAGPLLGGLFSDASGNRLSWRWAFWINLPIAAVAWLLLLISLKDIPLRRPSGISWKNLYEKFDIIGLICFMAGTVGLVLGFSFSSQFGWSSPATIVPLVVGSLVLILGSIYEKHTKRDALFPPLMFTNLTVVVILVISFLHNFAFNAGTFFLALYYQAVDGTSALEAGMRMLPYSLGSSLASMPTAWFIENRQRKTKTTIGQKIVVSLGLAIATLGFGLLIILNDSTPIALQEIAPLIAGIGIGMLFHPPYQVLTKALGPDGIASATSAFFLVRFTGSTTGLAVANAVFNGRLSRSPSASALISSTLSIPDLRNLPPSVREDVIKAVTLAIQTIWMVCTPCLGLAFILSPLLRTASIEPCTTYKESVTSPASHAAAEKQSAA